MSIPINKIFNKKAIIDAHERIKPYIHRTPVLSSSSIDQISGCELYFKCENFQKIGAFKMRGASNALLQLSKEQLKKGVVTHSSGNHAQAVALAARNLGAKAYIVMPENAPRVKVNAVKAYGGNITFCEANLKARESTTEKIIREKGACFIHPYDNPDIILGQATATKELLEEVPKLECIIAPVGGGGLMAGSALSAKFFGNGCKVYGSEPEGADDAQRSFRNKTLTPQLNPDTIADGLLTSLGKLNFEIIVNSLQDIFTVNDDEIRYAMQVIWERLKIVIEPSCAVPLAAVLKNPDVFKNTKTGIILSGGNIDVAHFINTIKKPSR